MRVEDARRIRVVHLLREDRAEPRHGHEVDLVSLQGIDHTMRVAIAVEVVTEGLPLDELDRDSGALGSIHRGTGPVDDRDCHRQPGVEDGLEDRPASRREHSEPPHDRTISDGLGVTTREGTESGCAPRVLASGADPWWAALGRPDGGRALTDCRSEAIAWP